MGEIKKALFDKVVYVSDDGNKSKAYAEIDNARAQNYVSRKDFNQYRSDKGIMIVYADANREREGAINSQGKEIIKPRKDQRVYVLGSSKILLGTLNEDSMTLLNYAGAIVEEYESAQCINDNYWRVKKNGLHGLINSNGEVVFNCEYASPISVKAKGVYFVDDKYSFAPQNKLFGKMNLDSEYHEQWFYAEKDGKYGIVDANNGEVVIPCEHKSKEEIKNSIEIYSEVIIAKRENKYGVLSTETGLEVVPFEYDRISCYEGALAQEFNQNHVLWVTKGNVSGVLSTIGKTLIPCEYENLSYYGTKPVLFKSGKFGNVGVFDSNFNTILENKYDTITMYEGKFHAKLDGKIGIYSQSGAIEMQHKYKTHYNELSFDETFGLSPVAEGDKYGYIDKKHRWVIAPKYDKANHFMSEGYAVVVGNNSDGDSDTKYKTGLINTRGDVVVPCEYYNICRFINDQLVVCQKYPDEGRFGEAHFDLFNVKSKELLTPVSRYTRFSSLEDGYFAGYYTSSDLEVGCDVFNEDGEIVGFDKETLEKLRLKHRRIPKTTK